MPLNKFAKQLLLSSYPSDRKQHRQNNLRGYTAQVDNIKFFIVQLKLVNTILYADDQVLMATSEDDLQTMAHHLKIIARKYKMTTSSTKTKSMAMWGNHIQRVKIVYKRQYY